MDDGWIETGRQLPPDGEVVETVDGGSVVRRLRRDRGRWWTPDRTTYVYFVPAAWRRIDEPIEADDPAGRGRSEAAGAEALARIRQLKGSHRIIHLACGWAGDQLDPGGTCPKCGGPFPTWEGDLPRETTPGSNVPTVRGLTFTEEELRSIREARGMES